MYIIYDYYTLKIINTFPADMPETFAQNSHRISNLYLSYRPITPLKAY